jgi:RHS repeat-associated protein
MQVHCADRRLMCPQGTAGVTSVEAQALHRDQLGSVRAVTTYLPLVSGGAVSTLRREAAITKPFCEQAKVLQATQVNPEHKGWIGERYDADAGLQFLNARYYDPELGFFLQPDWFEVTAPGVGTNRYSYSFNDPVNKMDPGGNDSWNLGGTLSSFFESLFTSSGNRSSAAADANARAVGTAVAREMGERALDVAEVISSPVPVVGGAVAILNGADPTLTIAGEALGPVGDVARWGRMGLGIAARNGDEVLEAAGDYSVYVSKRADGTVEYCGMTCDFNRRTLEHLRNGRVIQEVESNLTKATARGLEQAMINHYGLANLSNKINAIALSNPIYSSAVTAGQQVARRLGLF